jgi:hypothetical protein
MLQTKAVCGSCNAPFKDAAAQRALEERGIVWVPEAISSAGEAEWSLVSKMLCQLTLPSAATGIKVHMSGETKIRAWSCT